MESHLDRTGGFSLRLASVSDGIASSMLSTSLKKALCFRFVERGLRMPQQSVGVIVDVSFLQLVPKGRVHERVVEQTVTFLVLRVKEEIVEVIQTPHVPDDAIQLLLVERIKDMDDVVAVRRRW